MGILAKSDAIDAHLLALFGEKAEAPIRPITVGVERRLADLVVRRRQLVSMIVAEKNRREKAPAPLRRNIESLLRTFEKHRREGWNDMATRRMRRSSGNVFRILGVPQPRVSDLVLGKIDLLSIDILVNMLAKVGLRVTFTTRVRKRVD